MGHSFVFGTDGACGPLVLASSLGLMVHAVRVSSFTFGTDGARGPCVLASPLGVMLHAVLES